MCLPMTMELYCWRIEEEVQSRNNRGASLADLVHHALFNSRDFTSRLPSSAFNADVSTLQCTLCQITADTPSEPALTPFGGALVQRDLHTELGEKASQFAPDALNIAKFREDMEVAGRNMA